MKLVNWGKNHLYSSDKNPTFKCRKQTWILLKSSLFPLLLPIKYLHVHVCVLRQRKRQKPRDFNDLHDCVCPKFLFLHVFVSDNRQNKYLDILATVQVEITLFFVCCIYFLALTNKQN